MDILLNNLIVLAIYTGAGVLVKGITGSKLAPFAPWGVLLIHLGQVVGKLWAYSGAGGCLRCLALILPHGCFETVGLVLACIAGTRLVQKKQISRHLIAAVAFILVAAWLETTTGPKLTAYL